MSVSSLDRKRTPIDHVVLCTPSTVELADRQDARLVWSTYHYGSQCWLRPGLDERQRLLVLRAAVDELLRHITPDGYTCDGAYDLFLQGTEVAVVRDRRFGHSTRATPTSGGVPHDGFSA